MKQNVLRVALACAAFGLAATTAGPVAEACGGFFPQRMKSERTPSLAYEQVLIVHDDRQNVEHFIRQVAFRAGKESFGFVVPTPGKPEVEKVDRSPFADLLTSFPFEPQGLRVGAGGGGMGAGRSSGAGAPGGVQVLSVQKVGSFTAYVLSATDAGALAKWLADNKLASSPENDAWLAHYVKLKFFYVAMRYDPPRDAADAGASASAEAPIKAETIRISFPTALPYYPYMEPAHPPAPPDKPQPLEKRMVDLFVASREELVPVATFTEGGNTTWTRPFKAGLVGADARERLVSILGSKLARFVPEGTVSVATFVDQKTRRTGYGDVVFVPKNKTTFPPARKEKLKTLAAVLDPALLGGSVQ